MELDIKTKKEGSQLTVFLDGELNTITAPELADVLDQNLEGVDMLYFDFSGCELVSSAGLRVLLNTFKNMKKSGGKMELQNVGPNFGEILYITGLDKAFGHKK